MGVGRSVYKSPPPATPQFQNQHHNGNSASSLQFHRSRCSRLSGFSQALDLVTRGLAIWSSSSKNSVSRKMMMDRQQVVKQCDMEVMKRAMLKHEETFRQQVNELHRLYRIQRQLMSDLTREDEPVLMTNRRRSKQPRRALDLQLPADEYIVSADEDDEAAGAELLELTLAVGGRSSAAGRRKNSSRRRQEQHGGSPGGGSSPFGSSDDCSGASVLSSSPSSAGYNSDDGPAAVFHAPPPCQRAMAAFDLGDGMLRQQAPWLMQCQQYLTLRMT